MTEDEIRRENTIVERSEVNPRAFGELYEKYFDRIYNLSPRTCVPRTFVNALHQISISVPGTAWLYKIATDTAQN